MINVIKTDKMIIYPDEVKKEKEKTKKKNVVINVIRTEFEDPTQ